MGLDSVRFESFQDVAWSTAIKSNASKEYANTDVLGIQLWYEGELGLQNCSVYLLFWEVKVVYYYFSMKQPQTVILSHQHYYYFKI